MELNDYQEGFLGSQKEGALELLKAMQAGQITGRDTTGQSLTYEPLKVESLEKTLKVLTSRMKDVRLLNMMPKLTAYNTVEEFLQLSSYGADRGGFYNEGELSDTEDSQYVRRGELIKYMQVTGEVTLQAQMVRSYVDAMRKEVENKSMWISRRANAAMTKSDSDIVPQGWNSLYKQHASIGTGQEFLYADIESYYNSGVVVDMRGKSLKQINVEEAAVKIDANFGNVSDLFGPTSVISTLSQDYYASQRIMMNGGAYEGSLGVVAKSIATTIGDVNLQPDKFIATDPNRKVVDGATSAKAPNNPVAVSVTVTADSLSKYQSTEVGNVYYAVAAKNRFGESGLVVLDAAPAAVAVGFSQDLAFTSGGGANPATGYVIYRTKVTTAAVTGLDFYPIFEVSTAQKATGYDGGAATVVRDRGRILPDMETAFLTEMSEDVLSFKQLAPISKLDLAVLALSRRFITFLFATPNLYAPKKFVVFKNCAKRLTA